MINDSDLHCATSLRELMLEDNPALRPGARRKRKSDASTIPQLGRVVGQYSVSRYVDTRNLEEVPSYLVTAMQRLIVYPQELFDFAKTPVSYVDYVAMIEAHLKPSVLPGTRLKLVDYWPRTLNAAVSTDVSETKSTDSNVMRQHTSGSSTSTTNSFGVNLGLTGGGGPEGPSGSATLGGNWEHSSTSTSNVEDTLAHSLSRGMQMTGAASMTIKDWASYATIVQPEGHGNPSLRWIWGQEYPWDLFQYRAAGTENVVLPQFLQDRLGDVVSGWVAPPSQLSAFGLDLVAHATWQVIPPALSVEPPTMDFTLGGKVGQASHWMDATTSPIDADDNPPPPPPKVLRATVSSKSFLTCPVGGKPGDPQPGQSLLDSPLDLELLALDPVIGLTVDNGAAIGFSPDMVGKRPVTPNGTFRTISPANTLALRGRGFLLPSKDTPLKADVSDGGQAELEVLFKIVDTEAEYSLILKHWKTDARGCLLKFEVNGAVEIVRLIDDREGEGGSNNVTSITLRSTDFTSSDYHDYLRLGLNRVRITIDAARDAPRKTPHRCGYALRAIAIG